jgi:hypothetical protein
MASRPLASFSLQLTQTCVNEVLARMAVTNKVEIPPLSVDTRILGKLVLQGTITLSHFRVRISEGTASASVQAVPSFTLEYSGPGDRSLLVPLDVSFRIPEMVSVSLIHEGSKALMVLSNVDVALELERPGLIPERVWNLFGRQIDRLRGLIRKALDAALRQRPIRLFDLADHARFGLGDGKSLPTTLEFEELGFRGGALVCTVHVVDFPHTPPEVGPG